MGKAPITRFSSLAISPSETNNNNGFYTPQLTAAEIAAIPAATLVNGAIVYNKDTHNLNGYINGVWSVIDTGAGNGDVLGPNGAIQDNIATFSDNTGKTIQDSGVGIDQVGALLRDVFGANSKRSTLLTVNQIGNLGHVQFTNDVGLIFVDSLTPVGFITNDFGPDSHVCSLFTGGLPSSSTTPSALIELQTTTGALLLSRLTTTERDALIPANGMMIYNTDTHELNGYIDGIWELVAGGGGTGDVTGPDLSVVDNVVTFADIDGKTIKDSTIAIADVYSAGRPTYFIDTAEDTYNFFAATKAGNNTNTGIHNTGAGVYALYNLTTGSYNSSFGSYSLLSNDGGSNNCAFGDSALAGNVNGSNNLAVGQASLFFNFDGNNNVALGASCLYTNLGSNNIGIGTNVLYSNSNNSNNIGIGFEALKMNVASNNIALGTYALTQNETGQDNIGIGRNVLIASKNANDNIGIGTAVLNSNLDGNSNIGIGRGALALNVNSNNNIAIGLNSLFNNIAPNNIAIGSSSLFNNDNAPDNIAIGYRALSANKSGANNVVLGTDAALDSVSGSSNTIIGYQAGLNFTAYSECVFVGALAEAGNDSITNGIAIGYKAIVSTSNTIVLGNGCDAIVGGSITGTTLYGRRPSGTIYLSGNISATALSGIWTKIQGSTLSTNLNLFSMPITNRLRYIGIPSITALIHVNLNVKVNSGTLLGELFFAVFRNGVQVVPGYIPITVSTLNIFYSNSFHTTIPSLLPNDYIEVFAFSTNTNSITVRELTCTITAT